MFLLQCVNWIHRFIKWMLLWAIDGPFQKQWKEGGREELGGALYLIMRWRVKLQHASQPQHKMGWKLLCPRGPEQELEEQPYLEG